MTGTTCKQVTDSTQGFSLVLAVLKALHEHNVRRNLVADRYPKGIEEHQAVVLGFYLEQLIGFVSEADGALR